MCRIRAEVTCMFMNLVCMCEVSFRAIIVFSAHKVPELPADYEGVPQSDPRKVKQCFGLLRDEVMKARKSNGAWVCKTCGMRAENLRSCEDVNLKTISLANGSSKISEKDSRRGNEDDLHSTENLGRHSSKNPTKSVLDGISDDKKNQLWETFSKIDET